MTSRSKATVLLPLLLVLGCTFDPENIRARTAPFPGTDPSPPASPNSTPSRGIGEMSSASPTVLPSTKATASLPPGELRPGRIALLTGGGPGFENGTEQAAKFERPQALAVDVNGDVYVADTYNHAIRVIWHGGGVATLAGTGQAGYQDGHSTVARFREPSAIAVDRQGNVYVADTMNNCIRKVTKGNVTTLAGAGAPGSGNGPGLSATFYYPKGIAVDRTGNVFVTSGSMIRKIAPDGMVSTMAGSEARGSADGSGREARFGQLGALTIDQEDNLYVADGHKLRKVTPAGEVSTLAGSGQGFVDGTAAAAQFDGPFGISADSRGNVFVADGVNRCVRRVTPAGVVSTVIGRRPGEDWSNKTMRHPIGVAVYEDYSLFVLMEDFWPFYRVDMVREGTSPKLTEDTTVTTLPGPVGGRSMAIDSNGNAYVVGDGPTVKKVAPDGTVSVYAGSTEGMQDGLRDQAKFGSLAAIVVDANDNLYVTDQRYANIRRIDPAGNVTRYAGQTAFDPGNTYQDGARLDARFSRPTGLAIERAGNLLVVDGLLVRRISKDGAVSTVPKNTTFEGLRHVAAGPQGEVFLISTSNHRVAYLKPGSDILWDLAGGAQPGYVNGAGNMARFWHPGCAVADDAGNLYLVDEQNHAIRKIDRAGIVTTMASLGGRGRRDGKGAEALFEGPAGLALGPDKHLYVVESAPNGIRRIQ